MPRVHHAHLGDAAVRRVVAVVAQDKHAALRHLNGKADVAARGGELVDIGLVKRDVVDIDDALCKVDVHNLAFGGDDALDQRALQLGENHDVPRLRLVENRLQQHTVPVLQGRHHGGSVDPNQTKAKAEQQHHDQHGVDDTIHPVVELEIGGFLRRRFFHWKLLLH